MPVPVPQQRSVPAAETSHGDLTLLVIEDDPAGTTITVPELSAAAGTRVRIRTARNLTEAARLLTDDVDCILLDLALPLTGGGAGTGTTDSGSLPEPVSGRAGELAALTHVLGIAPLHAVLALTAQDDTELAAEAVRVGAQDYLFRGELDARVLSRAIRYAVERKRADIAQHQLTESRMRAQENARLERGLLPTPLLDGSGLSFAARYRPGRSRALLGGDFYDVVRTPDGTVHAMIGDVCGHGPDEAALGVELRIAWRALTLAGLCGDELLSTLQQVLEHERQSEEIFATLCTVDIAPDGRRAGLCLAGHPAPLLARHGLPARLLPYQDGGPALGLLPRARWPRRQVELGGAWSLMMYTDGLIEGRVGTGGSERLGQDGMVAMVNSRLEQGLAGEELLEAAVAEVRELNGGELTDDVAVLLLGRDPERIRRWGGSAPRSHPASVDRPPSPPARAAGAQRPPL
ncbi:MULTISPECIES: PP2C family protein-serine/threonine phosphatase [Streptomyces]|uniref:PP2C family protein-serine/threonine phosphatase n=1 Tax=Streptomyces TaxID=1883 RepID=UPI0002419C4E|nr:MULTISPECIES: fused response regulator/phosphatase [Streptomyces]EHM31230.1 putative regulatory protein [Streptomyces sp. W007]MCX4485610.1 fused response regulator/phosphatase [Streptomyces anulatus]MCX4519278.1 fused response regulator/phosphatase [Streptomyces anulatus]MCX4602159.1 fused response regulator/phosphatase [Streptomyces anulatus]WSI78525.1 fused response regulator/phosphatase [Streptomyces anulatus]